MTEQSIFERILIDYKSVELNRLSSYHVSYPEFLQFFVNNHILDKHSLTIGIHFTYGWMPTAFDFRIGDMDLILPILNNSKKTGTISSEDVRALKNYLNGSLVGTSKLLHFMLPDVFPIWDSRVYRYFHEEKPHFYRTDNVESYMRFCNICRSIAQHPAYEPAHNWIQSQLYPISKIRSLELIMFNKGGKPA